MHTSIHAHLMSTYCRDRIELATTAGPVERRGVRRRRIHTPPRRLPTAAVGQE